MPPRVRLPPPVFLRVPLPERLPVRAMSKGLAEASAVWTVMPPLVEATVMLAAEDQAALAPRMSPLRVMA